MHASATEEQGHPQCVLMETGRYLLVPGTVGPLHDSSLDGAGPVRGETRETND